MATTNKPYVTQSGDTWDVIAKRVFQAQLKPGDLGELYMDLMLEANPEHNYTLRFDAGLELVVPNLPTPERPVSLPPWRRA